MRKLCNWTFIKSVSFQSFRWNLYCTLHIFWSYRKRIPSGTWFSFLFDKCPWLLFLARIFLCNWVFCVKLWIYTLNFDYHLFLLILINYLNLFLCFCTHILLLILLFLDRLIWQFIFFVILFYNKIKNFFLRVFFWFPNISNITILKLLKLFLQNFNVFLIYYLICLFVLRWIIF